MNYQSREEAESKVELDAKNFVLKLVRKRTRPRVLVLPPRSPNLNAYAERFVLSIKSECLDRLIPLGERQLRRAIDAYAAHYHLERPHQGLGNRMIAGPPPGPHSGRGPVHRFDRLGGLLRSYRREAA
jgi:hypothetical protein